MKKLTVGIFLEHYDPFISGVVTSVKNLRAELEERGHTVYVICPRAKGHIDNDPYIIRIPAISTRFLDNATIGFPTPSTVRRLMDIKFDVIHSHDIFYAAGLGLMIARRQKIPYVQTYHTMWHRFLEQYYLKPGFKLVCLAAMVASYPFFFGFKSTSDFLRYYRAEIGADNFSNLMWGHMVNMSRQADAVVVPSRHLQKDFMASDTKKKVHQIPNGVAAQPVSPTNILSRKKNGELRLLSVSRFSSEKRLEVLVESLRYSKNNLLVMAGDGPGFTKTEELALRLGVADRIRFMGSLSNSAVRKLMKECDALLLASYQFDNQPMVILEAIQAGMPVIYCDPSIKEGLSRSNSLLVDKDARGFAAGYKILENAACRSDMAKASREVAEDFAICSVTDRILKVYHSAIKSISA